MALIKSETLKGKISLAEQTSQIYKETEFKKKITVIQWNLEKNTASSAAKKNQQELMAFNKDLLSVL